MTAFVKSAHARLHDDAAVEALARSFALALAQPALNNWDGAELIRPRDLG